MDHVHEGGGVGGDAHKPDGVKEKEAQVSNTITFRFDAPEKNYLIASFIFQWNRNIWNEIRSI